MTFEKFHKTFRKLYKLKLRKVGYIHDTRTVRNLRQAVRYVTKEDSKAVVYNIDEDYTSTVYRMRSYSKERKRLSFGDSIPSRLNPGERHVAKDYFNDQKRTEESTRQVELFQHVELRPWQLELICKKQYINFLTHLA